MGEFFVCDNHIIPPDRYAFSVLIDKREGQDSTPILNVMGMQRGSVISSPDANSEAHYLLSIGYDYQPCLSPEKLGE